jgi:two-component system sensor histidine kinase KdpD
MSLMTWRDRIHTVYASQAVGYLAAVLGVLFVALAFWPINEEVRGITAATGLLLVVLLVAIRWGTGPALVSSVLSAIYLNFFFVPPTRSFTFQLADGDDLVSLVAFLATSLLVGQLSARAQSRARENQRLYEQLKHAIQKTSHLEAIRQSEKLKTALLDAVTHELRTPLTSIKAAATALMAERKSPVAISARAREHFLKIIDEQSDRLNHFIEGMLELAKIESGDLVSARQQVPVEDIIGAALVRGEEMLARHSVVVDCDEGLSVLANAKAIAQVIFSLLENAVKYAPPGTRILVAASLREHEGFQLSVEDEGPGVPAPFRQQVFEKFYRGPNPESAHVSGMGLGLAIARGIVEAHNGRIWVDDRVGARGARFVFTLPYVQEPAPAELTESVAP